METECAKLPNRLAHALGRIHALLQRQVAFSFRRRLLSASDFARIEMLDVPPKLRNNTNEPQSVPPKEVSLTAHTKQNICPFVLPDLENLGGQKPMEYEPRSNGFTVEFRGSVTGQAI